MAEQVSEQVWTWVGTSNPAEKIFAIYIPTELINPIDLPERPSNMPKRESVLGVTPYVAPTKFKDLDPAFNVSHLCSLGVAEWQFIGESIGPKTSVFYFFKNKTAAELLVPYYDDSPGRVGNHPWEAIIYDIWVEADYDFPQSTHAIDPDTGELRVVTAPTLYIRALMADPAYKGSSFITRKYLSAVQPKRPRITTPDTRSIVVEVNGTRREFEPSYHDDIFISVQPSGTRSYSPTGVRTVAGSTSSLFFQATKPTTRRPFMLTWEPVRNEYGLWEITTVTVIPPKILELVIR